MAQKRKNAGKRLYNGLRSTERGTGKSAEDEHSGRPTSGADDVAKWNEVKDASLRFFDEISVAIDGSNGGGVVSAGENDGEDLWAIWDICGAKKVVSREADVWVGELSRCVGEQGWHEILSELRISLESFESVLEEMYSIRSKFLEDLQLQAPDSVATLVDRGETACQLSVIDLFGFVNTYADMYEKEYLLKETILSDLSHLLAEFTSRSKKTKTILDMDPEDATRSLQESLLSFSALWEHEPYIDSDQIELIGEKARIHNSLANGNTNTATTTTGGGQWRGFAAGGGMSPSGGAKGGVTSPSPRRESEPTNGIEFDRDVLRYLLHSPLQPATWRPRGAKATSSEAVRNENIGTHRQTTAAKIVRSVWKHYIPVSILNRTDQTSKTTGITKLWGFDDR
ncbi:hypothetical protein HK102_013780 [Quaeritorhiza haematococci]|nr:hypothetical protein HK102_013780 [Quaeritorhiza haematococci]